MRTAMRRPGSDPKSTPPTADWGLTPVGAAAAAADGVGRRIASPKSMARKRRRTPAGFVYHVCNRGSRKGVLFESSEDYDAYIDLMELARRKRPIRIIGYSLMRTHMHLLLWPQTDHAVPSFMK